MWLGVRSIPLGKETRNAWNDCGVRFVKRSNNTNTRIHRLVEQGNVRGIINLGSLDIECSNLDVPVFNRPDSIRAISHPVALRRTLDEFIPHQDNEDHWHKGGGYGGTNKIHHVDPECDRSLMDRQNHIEGQEYRILTVGDVIVQAAKKQSIEWKGGRHNVTYVWTGVEGVAKGGFIPHIKKAAQQIPYYNHTVLGWDIIHDGDRPWTIEINTSPGVNTQSAQRIISQIERVV